MRRFWLGCQRVSRILSACVLASGLLGTVVAGALLPLRYQRRAPDVDGDGRPDPMLWRLPSSGAVTNPTFCVATSSSNYTNTRQFQLGAPVTRYDADDLEGEFRVQAGMPLNVIHPSARLTRDDVTAVVATVERRIVRLLERRGLADGASPGGDCRGVRAIADRVSTR